MNKLLIIAAAVLVAALVLIPAADIDGAYHSIDGEKSVIAVEEDADFTILYSDSEHDTMDITFTTRLVDSKGNTVSGAVSPSTGTVDNKVPEILTVTAPKDAGSYTLEVVYNGTVTIDGTETEIEEITDRFSIKAVNPVTLTVDVKMKDQSVNLSGYGVYFWIDGQKMEDSYKTFTVSSSGTGSVKYDWVADVSSGKHTFWVESANGGVTDIAGLSEKHDFYVGDNDYSLAIAFAILFVIIMIILVVWIYRKPVKNFGKPKARRKN